MENTNGSAFSSLNRDHDVALRLLSLRKELQGQLAQVRITCAHIANYLSIHP